MYYLFFPLLDKEGKQVVRIPKYGDYFTSDGDVFFTTDTDHFILNHPILTLQKFEEDPLGEIKKIYEQYKDPKERETSPFYKYDVWQAIVKTMERLERK